MARTRLIKPDLFIDPDIGDLTVNARYFFTGLWCHADKEGRLVYEPRKLKILIFPFDRVNIDALVKELAVKPFLHIYPINGVTYLAIINWKKHQSPHHTEKESTLPVFNGDLTVKEPFLKGAGQDAPFNIRYQDNTTNTSIYIKDKDPVDNPPLHGATLYNLAKEGPKDVEEVFAYFCLKLNRRILLSKERAKLIFLRLMEGRTVQEMKTAIDNFSKDDWAERHKFCDLVYVIGVRNKVDNLDKWLAGKEGNKAVPAIDHPKNCPECWGIGLIQPPGGKAVTCWKKY